MILQPLVENAIDHGIDLKPEGRGCITVKGWLEPKENSEDCIILTVEDNGIGMDKLYYGEQYHLEVESREGQGTKITITFPARQHQP